MGAKSSIEWTDASYTPIRARNLETGKVGWHCERITTGCGTPTEGGCYSEAMNRRLGTGLPFKPGHRKDIEIFLDEEMLLAPLRWRKPKIIFVCSMTDAFADFVKDEWLDKMFAVMALCPQHTFQVLTKRSERMRAYMTLPHPAPNVDAWHARVCSAIDEIIPDRCALSVYAKINIAKLAPLPNVWLGVSAERQQEWDERKEHLKNTPAAVHFASFEPLVGGIVEPRPMSDFIQWAIVGGESGAKARPMHPEWARSLQGQCETAGVKFFFKQWGCWTPGENVDRRRGIVKVADWFDDEWTFGTENLADEDGHIDDEPDLYCVGKKAAGRLLDGREWNQMPEVHHA